jgi:hypothetical protein
MQVTLIAQWEVTVALALQLGVDRGSVDTTVQHPSFTAAYGHRSITVYIVGNPLATPGAYISTDGVAEQMSDIISSSGKHTLALFAHPEHLPRVYRSSIANFHGNVDATIFPAMIPYTLNWPVVGSGAIINLFADSAMMSGPNFGMCVSSSSSSTSSTSSTSSSTTSSTSSTSSSTTSAFLSLHPFLPSAL